MIKLSAQQNTHFHGIRYGSGIYDGKQIAWKAMSKQTTLNNKGI